jgi:hypothetical protein
MDVVVLAFRRWDGVVSEEAHHEEIFVFQSVEMGRGLVSERKVVMMGMS